MTERFMPVVDVADYWAIIEVVPGVTRSVHPEELSSDQVESAHLTLTPKKARKLRRLINA